MGEKIYKYRRVLILVGILILMWGWYFLFYAKKDIPLNKYSYYTDSDNQLFTKTKAVLENTIVEDGWTYINYVDDITYSNWTYGKNETGTFVAKAERQFTQEVQGYGVCTFRQKIIYNVNLDTTKKLYTLSAEISSTYKSPKHKSFVEWDVGNCRVGNTFTEEELRKAVFQADAASNKLDNFMSGLVTRLKNIFHTRGF